MDGLVPAFIAALLAGIGDRPARLAAILGDRFARPVQVFAATALAQLLVLGVAAGGGMIVGPFLTANAAALMLGMALAYAGLAAVRRTPRPDTLTGWNTGPLATSFLGMFSLALGDRTAFVAFALAARSPAPMLAGVGALAGALVLAGAAIASGERGWRRVPRYPLALGGGVILLIAGLVSAASGLRLI